MSINNIIPYRSFDYVSDDNPTVSINPPVPSLVWLNITTGEIFTCTDNTAGSNVWVGQLGNTVSPRVFDFFGDSSCVLWYAFNGDATDEGGNYDGTENNSPVYSSPSPDGSQFLLQDGTSGAASITRTLTATADGAVSVWFYVDSLRASNYDVVLLWDENGASPTRRIRIFDFGGTLVGNQVISFNLHFQNDTENVTVYPSIFLGQWHHVVISWEEGGLLGFYCDGYPIRETSYTGTSGDMDVPNIIIGAGPAYYGAGSGLELDGGIENVRIFNRGLTAAEVKTLYNSRA